MKLTQRLLLGALGVVGVLVVFMSVAVDRRLGSRLTAETTARLASEARLVAAQWTTVADADALANRLGAVTGHRVTLVDSSGRVIGDSEFDRPGLDQLENHNNRPEIIAARSGDVGSSRRTSASAGDEELYVAVRAPLGVARVSLTTKSLDAIVGAAQQEVALAGVAALAVAMILAWFFARAVSADHCEPLNSDAASATRERRFISGLSHVMKGSVIASGRYAPLRPCCASQ